MKPKPFLSCLLYCWRIAVHFERAMHHSGPSDDNPDWLEVLHYWHSKIHRP